MRDGRQEMVGEKWEASQEREGAGKEGEERGELQEGVNVFEWGGGGEMNSGMQIVIRKVPYDTLFRNLLSAFLKWPSFLIP